MNVEYIDPFIEATQDMLSQVANAKTTLGKVFSRNSSFNGDNVVIIVGIAGDLKGQVIFNLRNESACSIASSMMCGMPVSKLDDMARSAISELANMISGNAATIFSTKKIALDITPPTIMIGDNIEISTTKSTSVCAPLTMENGNSFEINISLSDN